MKAAMLYIMVLGAFSGLCEGDGVLPDGSLAASVGGTVTFRTYPNLTETPFQSLIWHIGDKTIIAWKPDSNMIAPEYENRITFFRSTGSLQLRNLGLNDSGDYRAIIIPAGGKYLKIETTSLVVYDPVSDVFLTASSTNLVEFSRSVRLSCSSSGPSLSFLWMNSSSEVTASDRVQISDGGSTLTLVTVTRYDLGPYSCHVSNPVSSVASQAVKLSVSYGPETVQLQVSPSQEHHETGSDIQMFCSAVSSPDASFQWFLNENPLPDTGPELRLTNVQTHQSGSYSCQAFNNRIRRYQTSQPSVLSVLDPVSDVLLTASSTDLVEFSRSVRLSCSSSGPSPSFLWMNSSSEVTASDRVQISSSDGGSTLTLVTVTRYDQGPYSCHVSNLVSSVSSEAVKLSVSYGPANVKLKVSPSETHYEKGSDLTLICSSASRPPAEVTWFSSEGLLADSGPELRLMNVQTHQSGNYVCQAFNSKTLRAQSSQPFALSVIKPGGLSGVAIAGIMISCLIVTAAGAVGGYFLLKIIKNGRASPGTALVISHVTSSSPGRPTEQPMYEDVSDVYDKRI